MANYAPATLCSPRTESELNQRRLEHLVFSDAYDPTMVQQLNVQTIQVDNFVLSAVKRLGSGTFGEVYLYHDSSQHVFLAIKFTSDDSENLISQALSTSGCNVLRAKPANVPVQNPSGSTKFIFPLFMEAAEGTLYKYRDQFLKQPYLVPLSPPDKKVAQTSQYLTIAETLRVQMLCIYDYKNEYVYTDLKPANVLYKCDNAGKLDSVRFFLGDLGSALVDQGTYISTYPPYEYMYDTGNIQLRNTFDKETAMAWELGVIMLFFVAPDLPEFSLLEYDKLHTLTTEAYHVLYNAMMSWYGASIALLLHTNPYYRRSIRQSLLA